MDRDPRYVRTSLRGGTGVPEGEEVSGSRAIDGQNHAPECTNPEGVELNLHVGGVLLFILQVLLSCCGSENKLRLTIFIT